VRFAEALKHATEAGTAALKVRFGSIAGAITSLAGQQDLLEYARGYDALISGRTEDKVISYRL
jgi:hypothetical protein